jgi:hypothetical protein
MKKSKFSLQKVLVQTLGERNYYKVGENKYWKIK